MQECTAIQNLLLEKSELLSTEERRIVAAHVKSCSECRQFQQQVETLSNTVHAKKVTISRSIRSDLLRQMREKGKAQNSESWLSQFIGNRKTALYQAAAVAILVLFFVMITNKVGEYRGSASQIYLSNSSEMEMLNVVNVQQVHQIVDSQKVGVTLSQDTVLSRILFTL